jgi:2-polyprenyl-3-methyl-5-hydroxy-6-metoxy-1,4-benzoquinol methylase
MEFFERQWRTYRDVVDHDWMEHRGITTAATDALRSWMAAHPERQGKARLLDLGCGDLALMGPVFGGLQLGSYVGVDLTEQVLPLARTALGRSPFEISFQHADISTFIATQRDIDLVHASLVLHHLDDDQKAAFLTGLREVVRPDGTFVWADVFRAPDESRDAYVARYAERIRRDWSAIDEADREAIVTHMSTFDFPADREAIVETAAKAGWDWQWLWQGHHQAEAVALLRPA